MIATRMQRGSRGTPRPDQCEGKWKSHTQAFRKCEDHNNKSRTLRRAAQDLAIQQGVLKLLRSPTTKIMWRTALL